MLLSTLFQTKISPMLPSSNASAAKLDLPIKAVAVLEAVLYAPNGVSLGETVVSFPLVVICIRPFGCAMIRVIKDSPD